MKLVTYLFSAAFMLSLVACSSSKSHNVEVFSADLKFCEGTTSYGDKILVTNFGSSQLNPLNSEQQGYVMMLGEGGMETFIESDGFLSAPKGMCVVDNYLLIADVNRVVVYNMSDLGSEPQVVQFPDGELFVNDIALYGNMVLVSVTNTGSIYSIDGSDLASAAAQTPAKVGSVPGANGLVVSGEKIYVASYDPADNPSSENIIYVATYGHAGLEVRPLFADMPYGQYDGVALSSDGASLITTTWCSSTKEAAAVWIIDLESGAIEELLPNIEFKGPADITVSGDYLYIPELVDSKLYRVEL